jgi:hypothetical protein
MKRMSPLPSDGRLLQLVGVGHTLVGAAIYRRELKAIGRDRVVAAVPYRGPKSTAFWFMVPSALIWIIGGLVNRAEQAGDAQALREAHGLSLASATLATACVPVSGFWAWIAISLRGLRAAWRQAPT